MTIFFLNAALPTFVLAMTQPIGFWDQSEQLECVCVHEKRQGGTQRQTHCIE